MLSYNQDDLTDFDNSDEDPDYLPSDESLSDKTENPEKEIENVNCDVIQAQEPDRTSK